LGKKHSLESVLNFYTRQIKKNQCVKKRLKGHYRSKGNQFDQLFKTVNQKVNAREQAEQWLVMQWFEEHEDPRFKAYIGEYYEPKNKKCLKNFDFAQLLQIVSPQNFINS
jgi:hypothetical protein